MSDDTRRLRIAVDLLAAGDGPAWSNLGCWDDATLQRLDYRAAAIALAKAHGDAVRLAPGQHLLDLGCGHGASLALWSTTYGIDQLTALESEPGTIAALCRQPLPAGTTVLKARFDELPLPDGLAPASCDAAVCIDAAYHARSLTAFATCANAAVRPGGRLAFTTLVQRPDAGNSPWRQRRLRHQLALAGMPAASLHDDESLRATLAIAGWDDVTCTPLDSVLMGFAAFARGRSAQLPLRQRLSAGWCKIALTGHLCASLAGSGLVDYQLISARRRS